MVKVLRGAAPGPVEGLGGLEGLPLWAGSLADATERAAQAAGAELAAGYTPGEELLVLPAAAALGPGFVQAAAALGRAEGRDLRVRLGGQLGGLLEELRLGGPAEAAVYLRPGVQGGLEERLAAAPEVTLDPAERQVPAPVPGGALPVSDRLILPVRHWVQLLWANLLGLPAVLWGRLLGPPWRAAPRVAWAAVRAGSLRPEDLAARLSCLEAGARVHRAAVVEGSWVGPGAQIGAGAIVRACVLGPGARVEEQALCEGLVLGAGAVVQRQAMFKYAVLGEQAMAGGTTQLSVLGPRAALKLGSYGMDQGLHGGVRVQAFGALRPAPFGLCGVCLGPGAVVGSGVHIAPGRALPPDHAVLADHALTDPRAAPGALASRVSGGRLEPL